MRIMHAKRTTPAWEHNRWNVENLKFLTSFMAAMHLSTSDIASSIHTPPQSIVHWFQVDDCQIDRIYQVFDAYGCKITFDIVRKDDPIDNLIIDEAVLATSPGKYTNYKLGFIRTAMKKYGYTIKMLHQAINEKVTPVSKSTVEQWFIKDRIYMSHVYRIAAAMDAELKITISKKPKNDD